MKKTSHKRPIRLLGTFLAAALLVSALPMAGLTASAAKIRGAYFTDGKPPFAYIVTGLKAEDGDNTARLYQNEDMQSYRDYTGTYTIPERVYDAEDMLYYTVTEIGGAVGDSIPGALQNVALQGITLPGTVTSIGAQAFAGCTSLTEMTFPTSITKVAYDAFTGVNLRKLTLDVSESAVLTSETSYSSGRTGVPVLLPRQFTDLAVSAPLTIAGQITVSGDTRISNTGVTLQSGSSLTLQGSLSGTGVIEVKNSSSLTLEASATAYRGSIRLTGSSAQFINHSSAPVTVMNAFGRNITVPSGETILGEQQDTSFNDPNNDPDVTAQPQISTNYGGSVTVQEFGRVVVISAFDGYHVENVVINGLSMGSITRYEFESASSQNTVVVTFAQGQELPGPNPITDPPVFSDVPATASYAEAVSFLANNGILQGVTRTSFAPQQKASRAMFLSVLKRLEIYGDDFQVICEEPVYPHDVEETAWYADAAAWAMGAGIFAPENGNLLPSRLITREEAALCLYHYTHARGYAALTDAGRYHAYLDSTMLLPESRQAMVWAATNGYLKTSGNTLNPAGTLTRAEMAEMLARYLKLN